MKTVCRCIMQSNSAKVSSVLQQQPFKMFELRVSSCNKQKERIKDLIRTSYEKYVLNSNPIVFKLQYALEELVLCEEEKEIPQLNFIQARIRTENNNAETKFEPSIYERGLQQRQMIEEKARHIKSFQEQNQQKDCTFSPSINQPNKSLSRPHRFEKLYEYGKMKVREKRSYSDQSERDLKEISNCTFQPKISVKSQMLSKASKTRLPDPQPQPQPQRSTPQEQVSKLLKQLISMNNPKKSAPIQKTNKLRTIFHLLDSDNDGIISPENISIDNLSVEVLKILYPFFQWMDESQVELNQEEFEEMAQKLIPSVRSLLTSTEVNRVKPGVQVVVKNNYGQARHTKSRTFKPNYVRY